MKKLFLLLIAIIFLFPLWPVQADSGYSIDSFKSTIEIQSDGSVTVTEIIDVTFTIASHGIYRYIPVVYQQENGEKKYTEIEIIDIREDNNYPEYETKYSTSNLEIKIGDPEKLINGNKRYIIQYSVKGVIESYTDYDELYWNVTGNGWDTPITSAATTVSIPLG